MTLIVSKILKECFNLKSLKCFQLTGTSTFADPVYFRLTGILEEEDVI